jgi:glycosyltransferase involved in cell wall biosynthesis
MMRLRTAALVLRQRISEYVIFDSRLAKAVLTILGLAAALTFRLSGNRLRSLGILCGIHRKGYSRAGDRIAERVVVGALHSTEARPVGAEYIRAVQPTAVTRKYFDQPERFIGPRILVVKSARPGEKGVIVMDYTELFPVAAKLFDLEAISRRYHIVLEPGWSGYCDLSILSLTTLPATVFVEAYEPRDARIIERVGLNLRVVPLSANWWVNHKIFRPLDRTKDIDVVMVASWASFKRHARFFGALRELKRRGHVIRTSLVGYPGGLPKEAVLEQAEFYGVRDQIEMYEWLSPDGVNEQFNRARVNIIWSRREGVNRAIIEGMFAGIPCIVRDGFNYGYRYPYINDATGMFSTEAGLPDTILQMLSRSEQMKPRDWVMTHMSCERSTRILEETIRTETVKDGGRWSEGLVPRVCFLSSQEYLNAEDAQRFTEDYQYLTSQLRVPAGVPSH